MFAESGVGAGIDSYYEYLMKAYILLGDDVFLQRFNIVSHPLVNYILPFWHWLSRFSCCAIILQTLCCFMLQPFNNFDAFSMLSVTALQCHYEVHQSASLAAQRAHAQPHCECPQLDGLPARVLPWIAGQI